MVKNSYKYLYKGIVRQKGVITGLEYVSGKNRRMGDILISTIIQCSIFIGIPWIFYLIFNRQKEGFFKWVGLYKPKDMSWVKWIVGAFIIAIIIMVGPVVLFTKLGYISPDVMNSKELSGRGFSLSTVVIVLSKAIFQTALSEEVLFRGFIGKVISRKFGYFLGNIIQSILFGLPHGLPFIIVYKYYALGVILIISAATVGFIQFYINEKKADGSIIPSFVNHSIMNIISFSLKAF